MSPRFVRSATLVTLGTTLAALTAPARADDESAPPLSIYGFARLDVLAGSARMDSLDEATFVVRDPGGAATGGELTMTPRLSQVGLDIDRWELDTIIHGEGKLEVDFGGGAGVNAIRLRHAYGKLSIGRREVVSLLAGQTWDLMSPLFPSTQQDTLLRYAGNLGDRRPQLRLEIHPTSRVHVAVAAATPGFFDRSDVDGDGVADGASTAAPVVQWLVELRNRVGRAGVMRFGVSGHVARTRLLDGREQATQSAGLHVFLPLGRQLVLLGEGFLGDNLADLGGGIGQGVNPMTGAVVRSAGGWIELAAMPTARHMLAFGTSGERAFDDGLSPGDRARNGTVYTVLRYKPRPALQLGLEHLYWRTRYHEMSTVTANRVDLHASVFF